MAVIKSEVLPNKLVNLDIIQKYLATFKIFLITSNYFRASYGLGIIVQFTQNCQSRKIRQSLFTFWLSSANLTNLTNFLTTTNSKGLPLLLPPWYHQEFPLISQYIEYDWVELLSLRHRPGR